MHLNITHSRPPEVRPREVESYAAAVAAGVVRPTPATPPPLLPGHTALQLFHRTLIGIAGWAVGLVVLSRAADWLLPQPWGDWTAIAGTWVGFIASLVMFRPMSRRKVEELNAGYVTIKFIFGSLTSLKGPDRPLRWDYGNELRMPWDYRGVWHLNNRGEVLTAPDRAVDAPGFYPSPNRAGMLEFWSGCTWAASYRSYPQS